MKTLLCLFALLFTAPPLLATDFTAGQHFDVIADKASPDSGVVEFFSYFCPHCYQFESVVHQLKPTLPSDKAFSRAPVPFLGRSMGPELQKAYAMAVLLKVDDKITPALFNLIHQQRQAPQSRDDVKKLFAAQGISNEQYDNNIDSMPVTLMVSEFDSAIEKFGIHAVPSFVVNGKYLVKVGSISSQQQFNELVNYLLTLKD